MAGTLLVSNVHFDSAGTTRIDYVDNDGVIRIASNAIKVPTGNTSSRPTSEEGLIRYNNEIGTFEGSNATSWGAIGGSGVLSFKSNVGNASSNTFNIGHNLNTTDVIPAVKENSTGYYVYPDIKTTSPNHIEIEFVSAPTVNQYRVIVLVS